MTDTEPTVEELRRWSAEGLMGWYLQDQMVNIATGKECRGYFNKEGLIYYEANWRPDDPTTGQIWMVEERMRLLGWWLVFDSGISGPRYAEFRKIGHSQLGYERDMNPCLAILKAAYQARRYKP